MPRTEQATLTLGGKPLIVGGRFVLRLLRVRNGKASIQVIDTLEKPPLVDIAIDEQEKTRLE